MEVLAQMSAALEAVLSGKAEGKLRSASERLGVLKGMTALSSSPCRGQGMADLAVNVATVLSTVYRWVSLRLKLLTHILHDMPLAFIISCHTKLAAM